MSIYSEMAVDGLKHTIDRMTTQGRFSELTTASARLVLPDPELPATPMILVFFHGGE